MLKYEVLTYSRSLKEYKHELIEVVLSTEGSFVPPISQRVDIDKYIEKLFEESVVFFAVDKKNRNVLGLSSFYCTPDVFQYAFLSYIAVLQKGKRIGEKLLNESLRYCKEKGMKGMDTQTWEGNEASLGLFSKLGFLQTGVVNNRDGDTRSILLRHEF